MNAEDLYHHREDLMTPEELEEWNHEPSEETIPTYSPQLRSWLLNMFEPSPDAEGKDEFLQRKPALGATLDLIEEARRHNKLLPPVQQRKLFKSVRSKMLRQLIPCPGATTLDELLNILQAELDGGVPSPVPDWYEFSTVQWGPRRIGYVACENRGCFETETVEKKFGRCTKCKLANYCSKSCQTADWKARHKQVCKKGGEFRDQTQRVGQMMAMFASGMGGSGGM